MIIKQLNETIKPLIEKVEEVKEIEKVQKPEKVKSQLKFKIDKKEITSEEVEKAIDFAINRLNLYKEDLLEGKPNCIFLINDALTALLPMGKLRVYKDGDDK